MNRLPRRRIRTTARALAATLALGAALIVVPSASAAARHRPTERVCPGPVAPTADCQARVVTDSKGTPLATTGPDGYGPAQFHTAYSLPTTAPSTQTIAIVDAYDDPTAESDLAVYNAEYGLPECTTANGCFTKVNQSGNPGPLPQANAGWALEIALDVETAHQICQNCKILLVEANNASFASLETAVNTAADLGATVISNSYGGSEYSSETNETAYNHPGVAVTASSGDAGYGAEYPASSRYVVAVGGTTLNLGASDSYASETVWGSSGSGCSAYEPALSWQTSDPNWAQTACGSKRGVSDVAADADPNTGAAIYDSTKYQGQSGWFTLGGTSLSAPLIAGVYALAGGGASAYPASVPYGHQSDSPASLHDVTAGSNGIICVGTIMCAAAPGYDGPTGVGTPNGLAAFQGTGAPIDNTPPQTTIDSGPVGTTSDPTPSFSFHSSEAGSTFECSISADAPSFGPCSGPGATHTPSTPLADGAYSFQVRATDPAGNTDPTAAVASFIVDSPDPSVVPTPPLPTTLLSPGPPETVLDGGLKKRLRTRRFTARVKFSFSSPEAGSSFLCRLDKASFAPCTSPSLIRVKPGKHTFQVQASGPGGVDPTPAGFSFRVTRCPLACPRA